MKVMITSCLTAKFYAVKTSKDSRLGFSMSHALPSTALAICSSVLLVMVLPQPRFTRNVMAKAPQWSLPKVLEATFLVATPKRHGTALVDGNTAIIPSCSVCRDLVEWAHRNISSSRTWAMGSGAIPIMDPPSAANNTSQVRFQNLGHTYSQNGFTSLAESVNAHLPCFITFFQHVSNMFLTFSDCDLH